MFCTGAFNTIQLTLLTFRSAQTVSKAQSAEEAIISFSGVRSSWLTSCEKAFPCPASCVKLVRAFPSKSPCDPTSYPALVLVQMRAKES